MWERACGVNDLPPIPGVGRGDHPIGSRRETGMPERLHRAADYAKLAQRFGDRIAVADLSGTMT